MSIQAETVKNVAKLARLHISKAVELARFYLDRMEEEASKPELGLNAYITLDPEGAMLAARQADILLAKGDAPPLTGVPLAVKDLFCTQGLPTTPGGSSGGSAAAMAAGLCLAAIGTDTAQNLGKLVGLVQQGTLSGKIAKEVFGYMFADGSDPQHIVEARGLQQVTDSASIEATVAQVLANHPGEVAQYQAGKIQVLGFLVGQVMKATQGKAKPALVNQWLQTQLTKQG